jgi:DNA-binding transcriptional ArsR family regulator
MRADETFAALADPTRRELLRRLAERPRRAGELAEGFRVSRPAIFKHARVLRKAGLVTASRSGRERIYRLKPSGYRAIEEVRRSIEEVSAFWDTALIAFKRHAEASR